jgi:hypothetical protein
VVAWHLDGSLARSLGVVCVRVCLVGGRGGRSAGGLARTGLGPARRRLVVVLVDFRRAGGLAGWSNVTKT